MPLAPIQRVQRSVCASAVLVASWRAPFAHAEDAALVGPAPAAQPAPAPVAAPSVVVAPAPAAEGPAPAAVSATPSVPSATDAALAQLSADVARLAANVDLLLEAQRRAGEHALWRAGLEKSYHEVSFWKPVGLMLSGTALVAPSVWLATDSKDTVTIGGVAAAFGAVLVVAGGVLTAQYARKRAAIRAQIRAGDGQFELSPVLGPSRAGLSLSVAVP